MHDMTDRILTRTEAQAAAIERAAARAECAAVRNERAAARLERAAEHAERAAARLERAQERALSPAPDPLPTLHPLLRMFSRSPFVAPEPGLAPLREPEPKLSPEMQSLAEMFGMSLRKPPFTTSGVLEFRNPALPAPTPASEPDRLARALTVRTPLNDLFRLE